MYLMVRLGANSDANGAIASSKARSGLPQMIRVGAVILPFTFIGSLNAALYQLIGPVMLPEKYINRLKLCELH